MDNKLSSFFLTFHFFILFCQYQNSYSQWIPTNGIYSGMIYTTVVNNCNLLTGRQVTVYSVRQTTEQPGLPLL